MPCVYQMKCSYFIIISENFIILEDLKRQEPLRFFFCSQFPDSNIRIHYTYIILFHISLLLECGLKPHQVIRWTPTIEIRVCKCKHKKNSIANENDSFCHIRFLSSNSGDYIHHPLIGVPRNYQPWFIWELCTLEILHPTTCIILCAELIRST